MNCSPTLDLYMHGRGGATAGSRTSACTLSEVHSAGIGRWHNSVCIFHNDMWSHTDSQQQFVDMWLHTLTPPPLIMAPALQDPLQDHRPASMS